VTRRMPEDRVARGSRTSGHRPLRHLPFLTLAICAALLTAGVATASAGSGGSALGGGSPGVPATSHHTRSSAAGATPISHSAGGGNPLSGRAMWIWELERAGHGDVSTIVRTARLYGIGTLLIKSGDGTDLWSQFNSSLVHALHANGLKVCAWQYVYGNHPVGEADIGAAAVHDGADCLIIDAESEYEGKYVSAQTYIQHLRSLVGANYPLALAGFPYVDYHPAFPYSVFLGPGGAQYNAPQMYWKDIGTTTDAVFAHTYAYNLIYGRPIFPLGQVYSNPPAPDLPLPRALARIRSPGRELVGLAGGQLLGVEGALAAGRRSQRLSALHPDGPDQEGRQGRPRRLGPGASDLRRLPAGCRRRFRAQHAPGGARVPEFPRPDGRRHRRPGHLVGAAALPARLHQMERARDDASRRHLRCRRHRRPLGAGALVGIPAGSA
jgi:hypothetical protein